ncbi:MarR family winged helix-turn-helix transcriptional regulator [Streptomyces sp. NPDC017943]|uniref:MarR family winged helix-turn-helix transcriptional regulator n=1 Tax=Streptomyces sp. NPDC017943 TaxID=3365019 RepID=UPI0037B0F89E
MTGSRGARTSQGLDQVAAGLVACLPALSRHLERSVDGRLPFPRLPERQLHLLRHVAEHEGVTVQRAAAALRMMPNNVSALVTRLSEAGLLERHPDDTDRRVAHLRVTPLARERIGEVEKIAAAHLASALRTLTDGDLDALGSALGALSAVTRHLRDQSV